MSDNLAAPPTSDGCPPLAALLVDQRCRWHAGECPPVEHYLERHPPLRADAEALLDLVYNEVLLRERRGETPGLDDYVSRFPHLAPALRLQFAMDGAISRVTVPETTAVVADLPTVPGYEVLGVLGKGGMGVVYKAWHVPLKRVVALKRIKGHEEAEPEDRARFRTEAEAVGRLQHPNIVQVYEVGEHDGRPYLALEYVDGGSLDGRLDGTPWPARQAATLVQTLAQAVQHAHARGVLHRDLKPANVLLAADGTPKVTDFGLAKLVVGGGDPQTQSEAILGTPSYMAPEQAAGQVRQIGPAADVYALGAVLYELLTGRPPFKGTTPLETILQVRAGDPVPPRRLRPETPRDLNTLCLKCLEKEPRRRYAGAEELAADLGRFLAGEPTQARPVGSAGRVLKWMKRRPAVAALWGLSAAILLVGGAGGGWQGHSRAVRRAETASAVGQALTQARALRDEAQARPGGDPIAWGMARAAAKRAEALLEQGEANEELSAEVAALLATFADDDKDHRMAGLLESIREHQADVLDGRFALSPSDRAYRAAFTDYGIDAATLDAEEAAARIRARPIADGLVAALDDWAQVGRVTQALESSVDWPRLLEVARRADPDPWRDRLRAALIRREGDSVKALAKEAEGAALPAYTWHLLGNTLRTLRDYPAAVPVLRRAQRQHPDNFWINHHLASCLNQQGAPHQDEAIGFYRAALALRPRSPGVRLNLGLALLARGDADQAIHYYQEAIALKPDYVMAYNNLGSALRQQNKFDEAITQFEKAIALDPNYARGYYNLGVTLLDKGRVERAIAAYEKTIAIDAAYVDAYVNLGRVLMNVGEFDRADVRLRQAIDLDDNNAMAHCNLGYVLCEKGRFAEALVEYRRGHALRPKSGWNYPSAEWVKTHERLLEQDGKLSAVLRGEAKPPSPAELTELARLNTHYGRKRFAATATMIRAAFADQPSWADDAQTYPRHYAACCAAMAAVSAEADAEPPDEGRPARWRGQALSWLRADLAARTKLMNGTTPADRAVTRRDLEYWQVDDWLASVREERSLAELPAGEREDWRRFWAEVKALALAAGNY